jgi:hypothetical protein
MKFRPHAFHATAVTLSSGSGNGLSRTGTPNFGPGVRDPLMLRCTERRIDELERGSHSEKQIFVVMSVANGRHSQCSRDALLKTMRRRA